MSIRLMSTVWSLDLPPTDKFVLLALADWADKEGYCWPYIRQLAEKTSLSERQVQRLLNRLEKNGLLEIARNAGRGNRSLYRIRVEELKKVAQASSFPIERGDEDVIFPDEHETETVTTETEKGAICDTEKVSFATEKGVICDTKPPVSCSSQKTCGAPYVTIHVTKNRQEEPSQENATPQAEAFGVACDARASHNARDVALPLPKEPRTSRRDPRSRHPAIQAVRELVGRYPPRALYDELITLIGDEVDERKLAACYREWCRRGYNPAAWAWATEWYTCGIPPRMGVGNGAHQASVAINRNELDFSVWDQCERI